MHFSAQMGNDFESACADNIKTLYDEVRTWWTRLT